MRVKILNLIAVLNAAAEILFIIFALPQTVAVHFGFAMNVDRVGSKWTLIILPIIPIIISAIFAIYRKTTKTKEEVQKNINIENEVVPMIFGVLVVMTWLFLTLSVVCEPVIGAKANIPIPSILVILMGIMMLVMSNFYGKIKQNKTFGIRLPWTLNNEQVWNKTHRFAGYVGICASLLMIVFGILCLVLQNNTLAIVGIILGVALQVIPATIYAYLLDKKLKKDN
ncbi:MAG: SdpI family protein [Oscillospiraceae bacterium]